MYYSLNSLFHVFHTIHILNGSSGMTNSDTILSSKWIVTSPAPRSVTKSEPKSEPESEAEGQVKCVMPHDEAMGSHPYFP